jgi:hypothetical protein
MAKKKDPGALAGATEARGHEVCGEQLLDTTNQRTGPASPELAAIGSYKLLAWEPSEGATGRVGIAIVLLPSGKRGGFAIYNLGQQFAEWWPTGSMRRVRRRDHRELNAALPFAVALVRKHDPNALPSEGSGLLPARSRFAEGGE